MSKLIPIIDWMENFIHNTKDRFSDFNFLIDEYTEAEITTAKKHFEKKGYRVIYPARKINEFRIEIKK